MHADRSSGSPYTQGGQAWAAVGRLWDAWSLQQRSTLPPCPPLPARRRPQDSEPVTALALSPDGRLLFAASRSLQLRCWSMESGQVLRSYKGHKAPIADMAVDATGGLLATSSADRTVRVGDVDAGFCTHPYTGHRCGEGKHI